MALNTGIVDGYTINGNMIFGISECSEEQYILPIPEKEYLGE